MANTNQFGALGDPQRPEDQLDPRRQLGALGDGGAQPTGAPQRPPQMGPAGGLGALGDGGAQPTGAPTRPTSPVGAPQAPAAPAAPAAPGFDPNQVWGTMQNQFQTQHGRAMTPQEAQALQQYAGYSGGDINQGMIDRATQGITSYTGDINNPFGGAPGGTDGAQPAQPDPGMATNALVQQQIQELLNTGSTPAMSNVDPNNPAMVAQRNAFNRMNERGGTRERLSAAERASARGTLGTGGFDAGQQSIEQGMGDRAAGFESQLMSQELQGQRDRVMQAMQMASQSGDSAQSRALSERLATIDNQLRREGMTMQNRLGQGQLGLGLLQALMGDRRAGDALGFNYAQLGQQGNSDLMRMILGASQ